MSAALPDPSNGYEAIAEIFLRARRPSIGPGIVGQWARRLAPGAQVLELGCGFGVISEVLIGAGFVLRGVDASPTLVARFRQRFPHVPVECGSAEESDFFGRTFDAVVAWGLMFLLPAKTQRRLIAKVARALAPKGHFLFTAPREPLTWTDGLTGVPSLSLGEEAYLREFAINGLELTGNDQDEGENYYYFAQKQAA